MTELVAFFRHLSVRTKAILGFFGLYLILQIQGFTWGLGHEFFFFLGRFAVGLLIFILLLNTNLPGLQRFALAVIYLLLLFGISKLNLWTFSANSYIDQHQPDFEKVIVLLKNRDIQNVSSISLTTVEENRLSLSSGEQQSLRALFDNTSVLEIDVTNGNVLFTFDRFLDNGYGLVYVTNPALHNNANSQARPGSRYEVPYDITSKIQLQGKWHYISFT